MCLIFSFAFSLHYLESFFSLMFYFSNIYFHIFLNGVFLFKLSYIHIYLYDIVCFNILFLYFVPNYIFQFILKHFFWNYVCVSHIKLFDKIQIKSVIYSKLMKSTDYI